MRTNGMETNIFIISAPTAKLDLGKIGHWQLLKQINKQFGSFVVRFFFLACFRIDFFCLIVQNKKNFCTNCQNQEEEENKI